MSRTMNSGETTFKQDLEGLAHQAGVIKTDVGVLAHGAAGAVRDGVSELRDGAGHAVDAAKESLAKAEESVKKHVADMETQAASMMKSLRGQVSAHPLAIVGIAVGVGIIAGVLLGRSRA